MNTTKSNFMTEMVTLFGSQAEFFLKNTGKIPTIKKVNREGRAVIQVSFEAEN